MADEKISALPVATNVIGARVPIIQDGTNKQADASLFGSESGTAAENDFWSVRAALLDPKAYVLVIDTSWSVTVPINERWYLREAWNARLGASGPDFFQRDPSNPIMLSPGTNLQGNGTANSHIYYCRPSLVTSLDTRYSNARALYYNRLAALQDLVLTAHGATYAGGDTASVYAPFPSDFDSAMMVGSQNMEAAWTILTHSPATGGINLGPEVSDLHQFRGGHGYDMLPLPFKRTDFPGISITPGSVAGTSGGSIAGTGTVFILKLPEDF